MSGNSGPIKAKPVEQEKTGLVEGIPIYKIGQTAYDDLQGEKGDTIFYSSYKGKIEFSDKTKGDRQPIVDLRVLFLLDKVFIIPRPDNKWFLFWEETDYEGIKCYAALFETNAKKPIWKIQFSNPTPAIPVIDGEVAYVATMGMAAKISLADGKLVWKHDSLFNPVNLAFQNMKRPMVYSNRVVFVDKPERGRRNYLDSLVVDPISGERKK